MELMISILSVGLFCGIFLILIGSIVCITNYIDNKRKLMQRIRVSDDRSEIQERHNRLIEKACFKHIMQVEIKKLNTAIKLLVSNPDVALSLLGIQNADLLHYKDMDSEQIAMSRLDGGNIMDALKVPTKMALLEQKNELFEEYNHSLKKEKEAMFAARMGYSRRINEKNGYCPKCKVLRRVDDNGDCIYCGTSIYSGNSSILEGKM